MDPSGDLKIKERLFKYPTPVVIMFLVAVFACGFLAAKLSDMSLLVNSGTHESRTVSGYKYINPLLECDNADQWLSSEFRPSLRMVQEVVNEQQRINHVSSVAVYFRDLNNGPWFGIEEKTPFAASSMLKTAHMIAVFKASEKDPSVLKRKIKYDHVYHTEAQTIEQEQKIVVGNEYAIEELVRRMIVFSDNEALYTLQDKVPEANADNVYIDLAMDFTPDNEISVRGYSTLFRVLFNASYLNYENSEKALQLLSHSTFNDGLRAGVPASVPVAHKFGERALANPLNQLHDCGIIYYPKHPYLLCIMTRGSKKEEMASTIAAVSRAVYTQMRSHFGGND